MDILYKILDLLWKSGLSETEFCKQAGINRSAVTDWKKGKTKSYMRHIPKIAEVLGVSEEYLLAADSTPTQTQRDEFNAMFEDFTDAEREQLKKYMKFIISQRKGDIL